MSSLISTRSITWLSFLNIALIVSSTSLVRCPSLTIFLKASLASWRSGCAVEIHLKPALAFTTIAAKGCLISWPIEAVITPIAAN